MLKKFCVLPWTGLNINSNGSTNPCCRYHGDGPNIANNSITDIRNSKMFTELRQDFLEGKQPEGCQHCWRDEDSGIESMRQGYLKFYAGRPRENEEWTTEAKPLLYSDVGLGNICNLRCRICGPWASSVWAVDQIKMLGSQGQAARWERMMLKLGSWPLNTVNIWPELTRTYQDIEVLKFYGGEPLMLEQHKELLESLVNNNQAGEVDLYYSTNGTMYSDAYADLWRKFHRVDISLSIDNIGPRFEYERKNAVWNEVVENLKKFKQLSDTNKNIVLSVNVTVSIFNVLYLEELVTWLKQNFDVPFKLIMLNVVEYYSISRLSDANKLEVERRLGGKFESVVRYMKQGTGTLEDQEKLVRAIKQFDEFREEKLADTHPELAELLVDK